jgi:hypothetical protein
MTSGWQAPGRQGLRTKLADEVTTNRGSGGLGTTRLGLAKMSVLIRARTEGPVAAAMTPLLAHGAVLVSGRGVRAAVISPDRSQTLYRSGAECHVRARFVSVDVDGDAPGFVQGMWS